MPPIDACLHFKPDSAHINALAQALRDDIHDLHTRADPAGDLQEIVDLRGQRDALLIQVEELRAEVARLKARE
jgi:hypothetical protein